MRYHGLLLDCSTGFSIVWLFVLRVKPWSLWILDNNGVRFILTVYTNRSLLADWPARHFAWHSLFLSHSAPFQSTFYNIAVSQMRKRTSIYKNMNLGVIVDCVGTVWLHIRKILWNDRWVSWDLENIYYYYLSEGEWKTRGCPTCCEILSACEYKWFIYLFEHCWFFLS